MNADLLVIIINIVIAHCGKEEEKEDSWERERERDDFKNKNNIYTNIK